MDPTATIGGAASWAGCEIGGSGTWAYEFDDRQLDELLAEVDALLPVRSDGGMAAVAAHRQSRLGAQIDDLLAEIRDEILHGTGIALVRELPVADLSLEECELLTWCIGSRIGVPIHQNERRDLIVHVCDEGKDFAEQHVRAYETAAPLTYHSDSSDVVGLLCVRPALSGGVSTVVSATRVHDEMVAADADLAALLYEQWWHYVPTTDAVISRAICVRRDGELFSHYGRRYLDLGGSDPRTPELDERQLAALELFDELTNRPDLVLNMNFQPGDLQLLNNYKVLHSRTGYSDHPDPALRRHLCRIWLVVPELVPPVEFEDIGFIPRTTAFSDVGR